MKKTNKITKVLAAAIAAIMMSTTAAGFMTSADNTPAAAGSSAAVLNVVASYNGHPIIEDTFDCDSGFAIPFRYSDGFFEEKPEAFNAQIATMSDVLSEASTTYVKGGDYTNGAKTIKATPHDPRLTPLHIICLPAFRHITQILLDVA